MAENSGKNKFTLAMVLAVVVVFVLGVFAVSGPVGEIIENGKITRLQNKIMSGNATVKDMADYSGMSEEEFLAGYTVEGITGKSTMTEFQEALTLKDFCAFAGVSYDDESFATYKAENNLGDDVTADTKDMEVKNGYVSYAYEAAQAAEEMLDTAASAE